MLALMFGAATLMNPGFAMAKKKKSAAPAQDDENPAAAGEAAPGKEAAPAAQAPDVEKPKRILDENQGPPKTDSLGHVHYGSPNAEGVGRVAVKAAPEEKIKVFLEGRYFGTAPITIYSVPKGDYILEATYPSGKQVSKPISIGENEEVPIDLGTAASLPSGSSAGNMFNAEMTPTRMHLTEASLVVAGLGVVAAVTFGILEMKAENDYNHAVLGQERDNIEKRGKNYALATNIGLAAIGVGVLGAAIFGYPLLLSSGEKKTALVLTPAVGPGLTGGVATLRF
jgi:hypothetical protein